MTDKITNELILEHLKAIQTKLSNHDQRFDGLENKLRAIKSHIGGLVQADLNRDTENATLQARLDRIEKRLELTE